MINKKNIVIFSSFFAIFLCLIIGYTIADQLENDVRVTPDSSLIYYLNVKYDGVDVSGNVSSDANVSEVYSDVMFVSDKLPDGLVFDGFVTTDDGTIGAFKRDNPSTPCLGKVIDDTQEEGNTGVWNNAHTEYTYHGLHYDEATRTVKFQVKNLKAGCQLNVGIKTKTPSKVDDTTTNEVEKRRDFYNYALLREKTFATISNLVHTFMGDENTTLYNVTYEFTGDVPIDALLPATTSYAKDTHISVNDNIMALGYKFNGWTSNDVTINNGKFVMPDHNVVLKGSFTAENPYTVTYNISGITPDDYVVPTVQEHYRNESVNVDSLNINDQFGNYKFNGWTSNDVEITDGTFMMPNKNVIITGSFSPITYSVSYKFQGSVLPNNSDALLPSSQIINPGELVELETINNVSGYTFLGWYKENSFVMPNDNVVVYGEWKKNANTFEPTISKEVLNSKTFYHPGDTVNYKITLTNTASFPIKNVMVKESMYSAKFKNSNDYTSVGNVATIPLIAAGDSVVLYSEYKIGNNDENIVLNNSSIVSASADNNYELADIIDTSDIEVNLQSKVRICTNVSGTDVGNSFQINIYNNDFNTWLYLDKGNCYNVYLSPGTYSIKELPPQEYNIKEVKGDILENNGSITISQGNSYNIEFINEFKQKGFYHAFGRMINEIVQGGA